MTTSVAEDQIVAFVGRILRLKDEERAIKADIREIYAEAKGDGFDKTVLGKIVSYIEKRESGANELAEAEAIFDLYLSAYDSAKRPRAHTHAREATEPQPETAAQSQGRATVAHDTSFAGTEGDEGQHPIQPETANETTGGLPVAAASGTAEETGRHSEAANAAELERRSAGVTGGESAASNSNPASMSPRNSLVEEGSGTTPTPAAPLDSFRQPDPAPAPRKQWGFNDPDPRCLNPFQCGVFSNLGSWCGKCKEAAGLPVAKTGGLTA